MCYYINTYTDWGCGYRQSTGRHRAECNRATCRLSNRHRNDVHECEQVCTAIQMEEQHIIMEERVDVCRACLEAGRMEHPQVFRNGSNGNIIYRRISY
ncbi:hypothetical protein BC628DRAFT_1530134 [Trametes gibbosa]|nr:hypothetical protein BC628DRAFT_1530134 [Trametes gibbosa]